MSRGNHLDIDDTLYVVTDNLRKADAFVTAAERLIGQPAGGTQSMDENGECEEDSYGYDDDADRFRNNLGHLIESAKLAIREAQYAHGQTVTKVDGHRAASVQPTTPSKHRRRT